MVDGDVGVLITVQRSERSALLREGGRRNRQYDRNKRGNVVSLKYMESPCGRAWPTGRFASHLPKLLIDKQAPM